MTTCHFRNCPGRTSGSVVRADGIELAYCVAHEAIARNLPLLRSAGCCASEGCGRPRGQRSPLCKSCRPRYSAWGLDGHLPAQEAPMTEPTTPPAAPQEAAGVGAPPSPACTAIDGEPCVCFVREGDCPHMPGNVDYTKGIRDRATAPGTDGESDGEPSVGDLMDAPLFVGGTDTAPELVARWGHVHTAPVQPMSAELDGLAALAARGQPPIAPGPTVAELQEQLVSERKRADDEAAEAARARGIVQSLSETITAITAALDADPERSPAWDADDQLIPLPRRVEIALMPDTAYERELRKSLHAVEAELFEVDRALHTLGAYGTGPTKERLLQVLTPEDRRAILEFDAAEARMDLARLKARRLNPAPPERVAELVAKVATLDARIAALDAG